jgi:hypothetical protein
LEGLPQSLGRRPLLGIAVAAGTFGLLGTVSALWQNPVFVRMTPAGALEVILLALMSALAGLYVMVKLPACWAGSAQLGGVMGFLGIACPTCNKVLMFVFGGQALLTYYEPVRIYVAVAGVAVLAAAVAHQLWRRVVRVERTRVEVT